MFIGHSFERTIKKRQKTGKVGKWEAEGEEKNLKNIRLINVC